ncbi:MAG: hypothetical protein LBL04_06875 [Bacteroidales bacterium]|nr:hypothetical protein [Bacteroidales bacterium]
MSLFDPDRSADPVRSGAAPMPVRNADLSGCVAADRVNGDCPVFRAALQLSEAISP